jgi:hypothetical protein
MVEVELSNESGQGRAGVSSGRSARSGSRRGRSGRADFLVRRRVLVQPERLSPVDERI